VDAPVVVRRGRLGTVCARGAWLGLLCGPSTSPLGVTLKSALVVILASALRPVGDLL